MFDDNLPSEQRAEGNYIAQADRGGIATVNVTLSDSLTPAEKRNRNEMLRKIQERIEQKLKTSLYNNFMLDISLQYWSDVVIYAKEIEFTESTEDNILHCFDVNDGKLLILGEPGSGKTILLFSLASSLVNRAISDISSSIPVILNLSSWSNKLKSLDEWISEELYNKYDVSNNLSRKWLNDNTLILLLDGLDEVADKSRAECIENINEFRSRYHAQMVICTREQEYEALEEQLMLQGAVLVQPPSDEQINSYLSQPGLEGLQIVVGESEQLHELLKNVIVHGVGRAGSGMSVGAGRPAQ